MGLILVRHTRPDVAAGTCYGRLDVGLADSFPTEARAVLEALPAIQRVVSSPLSRCLTLGRYIASAKDLPIDEDERLMELDFGAWESQPWAKVGAAALDDWAQDFLHARPHGGESVAMLRDRVAAALADWSARRELIAIVTHAGVIKAACMREGDGPWDFRPPVDFGGIITLPDGNPVEGGRMEHD